MPSAVAKFTTRQAQFCEEYLVDLNGTQAAIRAGYAARSAAVTACTLLRDAKIQARIAELQQARAERTQMDQDRVLLELAALSFSDIRRYEISDTGRVTLADGAPDHAMRAVGSIRAWITREKDGTTTRTVELKLWDKPASLRMAGQHLGMFREIVETRDRTIEA